MATNYKKLTLEALKVMRDEIVAEINAREAIVKAQLRQQFESVAAAKGFSLSDIVALPESTVTAPVAPAPEAKVKASPAVKAQAPAKAKDKTARPPRYIDPNDRNRSWTGIGPRPRWVLQFLESGGTMEALQNPARAEADKASAQKPPAAVQAITKKPAASVKAGAKKAPVTKANGAAVPAAKSDAAPAIANTGT